MEYQSTLNANVPRDLVFNFAVIMIYEPMSDKRYKVYKKLSPNEKAGMLVRHTMKIAKKYGVSDDFLKIFNDLREDYRYYSKEYKKMRKEIKEGNKDMKFLTNGIQIETKYMYLRSMVVRYTSYLLKKITNNKEFSIQVEKVNALEKK